MSDRPAIYGRLHRAADRLGLLREWYFVLVAAIIGLGMSIVAIAFIQPLHAIEHLADHTDGIWQEILVIALAPAVGGVLVGLVLRFIRVEGTGPGLSRVMFGIHRRKSRIPLRMIVREWLASSLTIGFGGSAGPEGPVATIGSTAGSGVGRLLRTRSHDTGALLGCGAAAGIASVFNAPIAGVFFTMEILLRDFSVRTLTPIVVAAVVAAATTHAVLGDAVLFDSNAAAIDNSFTLVELPNYVILGLLCGIGAIFFLRMLTICNRRFGHIAEHRRVPVWCLPAIGGLMLGILGVIWYAVSTANPDVGFAASGHVTPPFYGGGYPFIELMLGFDGGNAGQALFFFALIAAVGIAKGIATAIALGSGGSGGVFAPSLFLGAAVGAAFGLVINAVGLFPAAPPAHYALVGMAAMLAATLHAPLTAILLVYELTRTYEVVLPLMLSAVIATIVSRLWRSESAYTMPLARLGIRVGSMSDMTILRRMTVSDVRLIAPVFVHPDDSAERLLQLSERLSVRDFVVTDGRDRYVGLVTEANLTEALVFRESIPLLQVSELMQRDLPTVLPTETIDVVLDRFASQDTQALVVVSERGDGSVLGLLSRADVMAHYQRTLAVDA